ncbi:biotin synthase BioB [Brachyspira hampsonii]|uniref:Biotin synthase n=1 Tax=Brachyspira hampsonii TaxID=1287055 RepID=A0AAC9TT79_9SPIR|nr:biotin synthase BioB [Brachyspira hampsonii]ASJ21745.1 biotin synthase BioB [Brachyspira hampsonii]ELV05440.1 biotin synthase [Brachyspira hampsonii 30599]MBW5380989.1 biotin synthase BioB [Brachyspira hampsonii]MBW5409304.1 biotin synthase BioB [Brachyspira hampsonii]OEJ18800.1 biotin synthase BioB [Brachyspira hampsonii]
MSNIDLIIKEEINIEELRNKIINGYNITKEEAMQLVEAPLDNLCFLANRIRKHFCSNVFDMCSIINAKSGKCSENCKFCAQSSHYDTKCDEYDILNKEEILEQGKSDFDKGVLRYSIVTSGRALYGKEIDEVYNAIETLNKETDGYVCASLGLLDEEGFKKMKGAGLRRVHNNLEASRNFFPNVCTTHSYDDKIKAIKAAQKAGMVVCSGGIMGMGETWEDRIDMALELRDLGIMSIPVNMLNPIASTPFENIKPLTEDDMKRIVAIYRFINPKAFIRLAGGRGLLKDKGRACFLSGANAAITGDMLTTAGISIETDKKMAEDLGYKIILTED